MATTAPIKIDAETDELVGQVTHFTGSTKKDLVERAVREFIDNHRDEINEGVRAALLTLDGSKSAAVGLLTGFTPQELDDLGGFPK